MAFEAVKAMPHHYAEVEQLDLRDDLAFSDELTSPHDNSAEVTNAKKDILRLLCSTLFPLILLLIGGLWIFQTILASAEVTNSTSAFLSCGTTAAEAKTQGCQFDLLTYMWQPEECIEKETATEFEEWVHSADRRFGSFPFFANRSGEERIKNVEELSERVGTPTYTTQEEHLGHCIFWLRRLERIKQSNMRHNDVGQASHVVHCTGELLQRLRGENRLDIAELHSVFNIGIKSC